MKILLLLAHASPSVRNLYAEAAGPDVEVVPFVAPGVPGVPGGGLSLRYTHLAATLRRQSGSGDRLLLELLRHVHQPNALEEGRLIVLAWYSSGYALARELAGAFERDRIAGWIGIDGGHAPEESDGSPDDRSVGWLAGLIRDAAAGKTVLYYGASDVDPITYASSLATAKEAMRLAGLSGDFASEPCPKCRTVKRMLSFTKGSFRIERHDHRLDPTREHGRALDEWGPSLVKAGLDRVRAARGADAAPSPLPIVSRPSLGELALLAAEAELKINAAEVGQNAGPFVKKYLSGCVRGPTNAKVGLASAPWCAAFIGWTQQMALNALRTTSDPERPPPAPPHAWRAAVWELVEDARATGAWREVGYLPSPGDIAVFKREGQDPRVRYAIGHAARVRQPPTERGDYVTLDGNHNGCVALVERNLLDEDLVGWIAMPRSS